MTRDVTDVTTFLVIMDYPGAKTGRMPRAFYRRLQEVRDVSRIQKSVYLVTGVTALKTLVNLGKSFGFQVESFKAEKVK